jgi:hypothetical protein
MHETFVLVRLSYNEEKSQVSASKSNICGFVEIRMFIMSKNSTILSCTKYDFCNEDRYVDTCILLLVTFSQARIVQSVSRRIFFYPDVPGVESRKRLIFVLFPFFSTFKRSFILLWNFLLPYLKM